MSEFSDHVTDPREDEGPPIFDIDGETIVVPFHGRTEDGAYYDGARKLRPGEPGYDELLPHADPRPEIPRTRTPNPQTLARIRRAAGLE
ncbi:hypothetical protein AB4Y89_24485 [Terriglobus sp. 2YAB30_2]|uniref:hypothetical protein n=1 Tax=Terriglobus sp. 2YAB30_2 TaxID=3233023 RepID=UPI003F9E6EF0